MSGWGPRVYKPSGGSSGAIAPIQVPGNTGAVDPSFNLYNEVSSVASGVETDLFTYLVPLSPIIHLMRFEIGGSNIGQFKLYFDNTVVRQYMTWFNGTGLTGVWDFTTSGGGGLAVAPGTIIKIKVLHNRPFLGDYFAQMSGLNVN